MEQLPVHRSGEALSQGVSSEVQALAGYLPLDYLSRYGGSVDAHAIRKVRDERLPGLFQDKLARQRDALLALPEVVTSRRVFDRDTVAVGDEKELTEDGHARLQEALQAFVPWKKGPYELFGTPIDAEWRSDLKWARLAPYLRPLKGKKVADIGCHNGYFMFRMAAESPELAVGFEPEERHWLNFHLMQRYARVPSLAFELLGVEHIDLYTRFFDTVFCMGILYHHTDPVGLLRKMHGSMVSGGQLVVECQGIPGEESHALIPAGRYAKARGVWFLPTAPCLVNWIKRSGFINVECRYNAALCIDEQRRTPLAPIDSLSDFLAPDDKSKTIEGYPAPHRIYVTADKP